MEKEATLRDISETDSGGGESFLVCSRKLQYVSEGGDRDGSFDSVDSHGGCDCLSHFGDVRIRRQMTFLEIPPHRNPNTPRLLVVLTTPRSKLTGYRARDYIRRREIRDQNGDRPTRPRLGDGDGDERRTGEAEEEGSGRPNNCMIFSGN